MSHTVKHKGNEVKAETQKKMEESVKPPEKSKAAKCAPVKMKFKLEAMQGSGLRAVALKPDFEDAMTKETVGAPPNASIHMMIQNEETVKFFEDFDATFQVDFTKIPKEETKDG